MTIVGFMIVSVASGYAQIQSDGIHIKRPLAIAPSPTYKSAIGVRAGSTAGITFKHFIAGEGAVEGIIGVWRNAVRLTVVYEKHVPFGGVAGLNWYYGGGGHVSIYSEDRIHHWHWDPPEGWHRHDHAHPGSFGIGVDGILGIEYKIPPIPFAVSLDLKPFIEFTSANYVFWSFDPGLGIKFAF